MGILNNMLMWHSVDEDIDDTSFIGVERVLGDETLVHRFQNMNV